MTKSIALSRHVSAAALSHDVAQHGVDIARALIVSACGLALIAAGQALPF